MFFFQDDSKKPGDEVNVTNEEYKYKKQNSIYEMRLKQKI